MDAQQNSIKRPNVSEHNYTFKELQPTLIFKNKTIETGGALPNSSYEDSTTLMLKPG